MWFVGWLKTKLQLVVLRWALYIIFTHTNGVQIVFGVVITLGA